MGNTTLKKTFNTLSQLSDYYTKLGYNYVFLLNEKKELAQDWCIAGCYRFEGASNPSDNSIVYLLHKKDNTAKGLLVNAYGMYSFGEINNFIQNVLACGSM